MTSMVGNLSQGEKFAPFRPQINHVVQRMDSLSAECEKLLQADMASFNLYMDALKLPKSTDEEKRVRKNALHEAVLQAIDVPLRLMMVCQAGLVYTCSIAESSNKNVISDLGIGAILLEAAGQSAALTVEINLVSLQDPEMKQRYSDKLSTLMGEIGELKNAILQITRSRMMQ